MMQVLLVAAWVASALAACGAALAWSAARGRDGVSRAVAFLVAVLGFVPLAWTAGHWFYLRWTVGDYDALVWLGGVGLAWHAFGLVSLLRSSRRQDWAPAVLPWMGAALVGAALTTLIFGQLDLRGRLLAAQLRLEGGELARGLLRPPPDPEDDAWVGYLELEGKLESVVDLDAWIADVRSVRDGGALDVEDAALLARVEAAGPILAEGRRYCGRPDCDFAGRRGSQRKDWFVEGLSFAPAADLAGALLLEGALAAGQGRTDLAIEDLECLFRISDQAMSSPLLLDLMVGYMVRLYALELLSRVLPVASQSELSRLHASLPAPAAPRAKEALDMEFAWGLSTFGLLGEGYTIVDEPGHWSSEVDTSLYLAFRFRRDVAGYRAVMAACRELSEGSLAEVARQRETGELAQRARSHGVLAMIAVPNVSNHLWGLHQIDARVQLAAQALSALEADRAAALAQGTWTAVDPAWGDDPPTFTLRGAP